MRQRSAHALSRVAPRLSSMRVVPGLPVSSRNAGSAQTATAARHQVAQSISEMTNSSPSAKYRSAPPNAVNIPITNRFQSQIGSTIGLVRNSWKKLEDGRSGLSRLGLQTAASQAERRTHQTHSPFWIAWTSVSLLNESVERDVGMPLTEVLAVI